ncbi:hypothetical protein M3Y96_00637300 [Aphelenchoides besseyi]|nr:hypothetical protein M3Y96_00637300 [Aphelenchoides besseyi]
MVWDLATVQFASDMTACVLGMIFNSLLIVAIFKATDQNLRSYSYLLLASASFDLFFSIVEFCTLHQLLSVSGILVIMSHGFVERFLFSGDASVSVLIRDLSVTCGLGWLMAFMAWRGTVISGRRGREYYLAAVNSQTFYKRTEEFYLYVSDHQDWITAVYFKSSFWFTYICFGASIFYALKSYLYVRSNGLMRNSRTERMQSQFTRSLIVQTVNTCIFALIPLSFSSIPMQFSNNSQLHGFMTMILISWLSTANAICTLSIIRSYKVYFLKLVGLKRFLGASVTDESNRTFNTDTRIIFLQV